MTDGLNLVPRVEYRRNGKAYWYLDNLDAQPAYEVVDFSLALKSDRRWSVTAFVNNAFKEEWQSTFNNARFEGLLGGTNIFWPSPRRQFGVRLSYEFL